MHKLKILYALIAEVNCEKLHIFRHLQRVLLYNQIIMTIIWTDKKHVCIILVFHKLVENF